jgi:hypothetical protein
VGQLSEVALIMVHELLFELNFHHDAEVNKGLERAARASTAITFALLKARLSKRKRYERWNGNNQHSMAFSVCCISWICRSLRSFALQNKRIQQSVQAKNTIIV